MLSYVEKIQSNGYEHVFQLWSFMIWLLWQCSPSEHAWFIVGPDPLEAIVTGSDMIRTYCGTVVLCVLC